jgi:outer membrane biosynthesis protein TonB
MAIYRLHKKEWENGVRPPLPSSLKSITDGTTTPGVDGNAETKTKKRKRDSGTAKQRERTADDEEWIDVSTDSGNEDGQDDEPAITSTPTPKTKSAQKQKQKLKKSKSKAKRGQGISSGLSTVIKQRGPNDTEGSKRIVSRHGGKNEVKSTSTSGTKKAWWAELPNSRGVGAGVGATAGKKGSMRVTMSS